MLIGLDYCSTGEWGIRLVTGYCTPFSNDSNSKNILPTIHKSLNDANFEEEKILLIRVLGMTIYLLSHEAVP